MGHNRARRADLNRLASQSFDRAMTGELAGVATRTVQPASCGSRSMRASQAGRHDSQNARELSELDLGDDIEALNLTSDAAKCADAASGILQATDQLAEQLSELYHSLSRETRPGIEPITGAFEGYFEKVDELNAATSEHEYELWRCGHARPDVDIDEMVANARDVIERARASRRSSPGERMTDSGS